MMIFSIMGGHSGFCFQDCQVQSCLMNVLFGDIQDLGSVGIWSVISIITGAGQTEVAEDDFGKYWYINKE